MLTIENKGREPTFEVGKAKTIIDITLSARLNASILDWEVIRENNYTDHNTIKFKINTETVTIPPCRKWHKADWKVFTTDLNSRSMQLRDNITPQRMEDAVTKFYTNINKSLDAACPLSKTHHSRQKQSVVDTRNRRQKKPTRHIIQTQA